MYVWFVFLQSNTLAAILVLAVVAAFDIQATFISVASWGLRGTLGACVVVTACFELGRKSVTDAGVGENSARRRCDRGSLRLRCCNSEAGEGGKREDNRSVHSDVMSRVAMRWHNLGE